MSVYTAREELLLELAQAMGSDEEVEKRIAELDEALQPMLEDFLSGATNASSSESEQLENRTMVFQLILNGHP